MPSLHASLRGRVRFLQQQTALVYGRRYSYQRALTVVRDTGLQAARLAQQRRWPLGRSHCYLHDPLLDDEYREARSLSPTGEVADLRCERCVAVFFCPADADEPRPTQCDACREERWLRRQLQDPVSNAARFFAAEARQRLSPLRGFAEAGRALEELKRAQRAVLSRDPLRDAFKTVGDALRREQAQREEFARLVRDQLSSFGRLGRVAQEAASAHKQLLASVREASKFGQSLAQIAETQRSALAQIAETQRSALAQIAETQRSALALFRPGRQRALLGEAVRAQQELLASVASIRRDAMASFKLPAARRLRDVTEHDQE